MADLKGAFGHSLDGAEVTDQARQDASAAFGGFVEQDGVAVLQVQQRLGRELAALQLKRRLDAALQRILEGRPGTLAPSQNVARMTCLRPSLSAKRSVVIIS